MQAQTIRTSGSGEPDAAGVARQRWEVLAKRIGPRYADCRLANYTATCPAQEAAVDSVRKFCEGMPANTKAGANAILFGPPGTGKDHLMAAMLAAVVRAGATAHWCNGADLFGALRDSIDGDLREADVLKRYIEPDVLAISDPVPPLGVQLTPFQAGMLLRIIDARYRQLRGTWMTVNVTTGEEAENRLGSQVVDRLRDDGALRVFCNWISHRKRVLS